MFVTWDLGEEGDCTRLHCRLGEEPGGGEVLMLTTFKKGGRVTFRINYTFRGARGRGCTRAGIKWCGPRLNETDLSSMYCTH